MTGTGHQLQFKRYVRCIHCMQASTYRAAHRIFASSCTDTPTGPGHSVQVFKGLRICTNCRAYSKDGFARKLLKGACKPKRHGAEARALADVRKGFIPEQLPTGWWPDGSAGRRRPGLKESNAIDRRAAKSKARATAKAQGQAGYSSAGTAASSKRKKPVE